MHRYCLDTSGLSNPLEVMPDDIYVSLWTEVIRVVETGILCWNEEIDGELKSIPGRIGDCLKGCKSSCYKLDNKKGDNPQIHCVAGREGRLG